MRARSLVLGAVLGTTLVVPRIQAAESEREAKWQVSIPITFTSGASYDGQAGSSFDMSDDLGWGFGFGYNFSEKLMFGVDFTWISANYDAHVATDFDGDEIPDDSVDISGTLDASNLQLVAQFNFMERSITPFVRANLGWTWVDSNIPAGPAEGVCWWDPWWGYVCDTWQPTFEDTSFSYGAAAGVRAEFAQRVFIEASYNLLWLDLEEDTVSLDGVRVNFGWTF